MRTLPCLLVLLVASCSVPTGTQRLTRICATGVVTVAHRGASATHPENTLPAFRQALVAGAEMVELDFYQSRDGVLVCFHDKQLERTTDAATSQQKTGIRDHDLATLQTLDAGSWKNPRFAGTRIPTLRDALATIQAGAMTMIEHKQGDAAALVALLRDMELCDAVLVQSFDWTWLRELRALEPRIALAALGGTRSRPRLDPTALAEIQALGACMVHWSFKHLRAEDLQAAVQAGLLVCAYTVNEPEDLRRGIAMGLHCITTDHPQRLRRLIQARDR